ncbi:TetR/AcrR family transcriptional regulator [Mycolicibacterium parafortuitum]|uniref:Transcriptional regulator [Gordonia sp. KTR9] n=1 Tax=Mycolicibacterium parafortuitum TaxID=39692 RepID=A0A375YLN7_MYCPF|nr:TetR/AcrR family transcriptional regulator [Mycolicibacterium parafortuitum]ORB30048.1 TetR family transcriptional regulator [Mycolicibacterium parafortuitum]SRX82046.1 Transcriptional regulator [Gordonia sp. KTR9] [Mycolicibacterium parafortuitum]
MINHTTGLSAVRDPARRPHGSRRDPAIDEAVLEATRKLLVTRGYSATSIDLIAATARVSRPAIYRRWRSKAHLIHEAAFPDPGTSACEDDVAAEITRLCRGALTLYADPVTREAIPGLLHDLRLEPAMRRLIDDRLEAAARRQLAGQLQHGEADGTVRVGTDADTVMDVIAGAAWYAVVVRKVADLEAAAAQLADLVLRGVLARQTDG